MPRPRFLPIRPWLVLLLGASLPGAAADAVEKWMGPTIAGSLEAPPKNETSGLAASHRRADLLWVHDDSGGEAALYGVSRAGELRGTLTISGTHNEDWEDLAAAEMDGMAWLIIGDCGDNDARRRHVRLHFVAEPAAEETAAGFRLAIRPAATLQVTYEDGPRDCEAIAVDPAERAIYLLTKRDEPPGLYRIALPTPLQSAKVVARQVGRVPHLPPPSRAQQAVKGPLGRHRARPCALDFAPDGTRAIVLTYGDLLLFPRASGETWAAALAREPQRLAPHGLPQAEAACFSPDGGQIWVASEGTRRLLRYDRP